MGRMDQVLRKTKNCAVKEALSCDLCLRWRGLYRKEKWPFVSGSWIQNWKMWNCSSGVSVVGLDSVLASSTEFLCNIFQGFYPQTFYKCILPLKGSLLGTICKVPSGELQLKAMTPWLSLYSKFDCKHQVGHLKSMEIFFSFSFCSSIWKQMILSVSSFFCETLLAACRGMGGAII